MNKNVGRFDRVARIVVGAVLISLVFLGPRTAWGWIGLVPLLTGLMSWCPAYSVFGIGTRRGPEARAAEAEERPARG
jgi:hypothetical protein